MANQRNGRSVPYDAHEAVALSPHVIEKIYCLSVMFFAERAIAAEAAKTARARPQRRRSRNLTIMEQLRNELFLNSSTTLFVEVAIFMRILDDKFEGKYPIGDDVSLACGRLTRGKEKVELSLREACNKIIHAKGFQFSQSILDSGESDIASPIFYYDPVVLFWGEHGKSDWMAALDVRRFCDVAALICRVTLF